LTILAVVIDGLGGFDDTELQQAATPRLDALAADGIVGPLDPVDRGSARVPAQDIWPCSATTG
jgi:2,3-bisphosphoglycerate-independent phosphoglycerate mutase